MVLQNDDLRMSAKPITISPYETRIITFIRIAPEFLHIHLPNGYQKQFLIEHSNGFK